LKYYAPERGEEGYLIAKQCLEALLPPGTVIWVESSYLDAFGRALCNCYSLEGVNILDLLPQQWREK
jgi:hypothetical protein